MTLESPYMMDLPQFEEAELPLYKAAAGSGEWRRPHGDVAAFVSGRRHPNAAACTCRLSGDAA
jgi:hypothetical protein